jgi:hypothetical protein
MAHQLDVRNDLISLVQDEGFALAQVAYAQLDFTEALAHQHPNASRQFGRVVGTDERTFWMNNNKIVAIWNEEHRVGAIGVSHRI